MAVENIGLIKEHCDFDVERELAELGVSKVISFIAKGWRGFVFKVKIGKRIAALKIGAEERILKEASVLKAANRIKIGPKIYGVSKHCVAMQFINGKRYPEFVENATKKQVKSAVDEIIRQAKRLDKAGIDHGELSRADKHIIVSAGNVKPKAQGLRPKASISFIDFEKGSIARRTHNVGAVVNYLLLNPHSFPARATREKLNISPAELQGYARRKMGDRGSKN